MKNCSVFPCKFHPYCDDKYCPNKPVPLPGVDPIIYQNPRTIGGPIQGGSSTVSLYSKVCPTCNTMFYNMYHEKDKIYCPRCTKQVEADAKEQATYPKADSDYEKELAGWKEEAELMEKRRADLVSLIKQIYKTTDIFTVHRLIEEKFFR